MKDRFVYSIRRGLEKHLSLQDKVVVAFSGGPDSTALLEALLEIGLYQVHVAHVDHGWREESSREAAQLEEKMGQRGIPFHLKKLQFQGAADLENRCREERYKFFTELYQTLGAKALLLGHHKDDLAETVLKRLFEGAHLENLGGMQEKSSWGSLQILRPLLNTDKEEILSWLDQKQIPYLVDRTNEDPKFLRTRLRRQVIPLLEEAFGKNVKKNLILLSKRSLHLKEYLDGKSQHLEIEHVLLNASKEHKLGLSASECDAIITAYLEKKKVRIERKEGTWHTDKGQIFIERKTKSPDSGKVILKI